MKMTAEKALTIAMGVGIAAGFLLGIAAQGAAPDALVSRLIDGIQIFGKLFLSALKMVVTPLVFFSVASGIANLSGTGEIGRKLGKTMAYFIATSAVAILIGMFYTGVIAPGKGQNVEELTAKLNASAYADAKSLQGSVALKAPKTVSEFVDVQLANVFMNPFKALAETNLVGVVFFAMMLGLAMALCHESARSAIDVFNAMNEAFMKIVAVVIWLAPPGVMALAAGLLRNLGWDIIAPLAKYFLTVVLAFATHFFVTYPLLLWVLARYNPAKFFLRMQEVYLLAISSASSAATLPVNLRVVQESVGVDARSANLVLPMGATINMDGTALYEAAAAMFVAQLLGMELTILQQLMLFITANLAAIGAAGIPQAGLVTMVIVFNALGIPLEFMAIIIVVDRPLDHLRTVLNVTGDAVGAVFLSSSEGLLKEPAA